MNFGVILIVNSWLNEKLVHAISKQTNNIIIHTFGISRRTSTSIKNKYKDYAVHTHTAGALHNRSYVKIVNNSLRKLRERNVDYYFCLHGNAAIINSLDNLFFSAREFPDSNMIEMRSDKSQTSKRYQKYYYGNKYISFVFNYFISLTSERRFRSIGFHYGHDAWGMNKKTVDFIFSSELCGYMYMLSCFTYDTKNFFFHTLAFHSNIDTTENSPELYASHDLKNYHIAYTDHCAVLTQMNTCLFYPAAPSAPVLKAENAIVPAGKKEHSPFSDYSASHPKLFSNHIGKLGRLSTLKKQFFMLHYADKDAAAKLITALNKCNDIVCHGNVLSENNIDYHAEDHICPRYLPHQTTLRDYNLATFAYDLIQFYQNKNVGFSIDLTALSESTIYDAWQLPTSQGIFILPDHLLSILSNSITAKKNVLTLTATLNANNQNRLDQKNIYSSTFLTYLMNILSNDRFNGNLPILVPSSYLESQKNIEELVSNIQSFFNTKSSSC